MRADRLLSILLLLQARGQLTGRELAKRLEVSERTLHRDMDALSAAGVPVFALRGSRGGWQLEENWRTQVPGLDESELRALLMAQPRVLGDRKLAAAAERALGKLMASLPVPLRARAESIRQRLYVDTAGWRGATEDISLLPIVQEAVARDRKLKIRYSNRRSRFEHAVEPGEPPNTSDRVVDPLGLVAKGSTWYLVANTAKGFRTFRVSRIENAILLDLPCEQPANFDLEVHWRSSTEEFLKGRSRFEATLCLHPDATREMKLWRMMSQAPDETSDTPKEGWTTLRVQFEDEQQALFVVLGFGSKAMVLAPATLRDSVAGELAATVALYGVSQQRSSVQATRLS
jgi:predicted DNA-binding transcriptional regulator YafY